MPHTSTGLSPAEIITPCLKKTLGGSGLFQWHEEHVANSLNQPSGFKGKLKFILQLNYFILEIFFWKKLVEIEKNLISQLAD